jgi:ATP-dependent Zn protease
VLAGPERKGRIPDEEANMITAYHEGGHAVVAYFTKDSHPLHKVTIIPRGPSLGHVSNTQMYNTHKYFFNNLLKYCIRALNCPIQPMQLIQHYLH